MQGLGQLLVSTLLLLPLLSVLAHKTDESHSPHLSKRSVDDAADDEEPSWQASTSPSSSDDVGAGKRFNEFVGKRALPASFESAGAQRSPLATLYKRLVTKREAAAGESPAGVVKRSAQYEFLGKRPLPLLKRPLTDFFGKRVRLPYEFLGKRIFGSAWERVRANAVDGDALIKEMTDILNDRDATPAVDDDNDDDHHHHLQHSGSSASRDKRYAEWLGKRGGPIADQLLRDLVNKRISAMMRNRLQNSANPEFIGRREESEMPEDLDVEKRYTEFIGK